MWESFKGFFGRKSTQLGCFFLAGVALGAGGVYGYDKFGSKIEEPQAQPDPEPEQEYAE